MAFTDIVDVLFEIVTARISLVFLVSNGIIKIFWKAMGRKKTQENIVVSQE